MLAEQGQVELFGDGDFRCPLSNLPAPAVQVDGGYRIDGGWDYSSGCDVATHFIGGASSRRRATSRSTLDGRRSRDGVRDHRQLGHARDARHRARAASSSRTCSSPSTTRSRRPTPTRPVVEFPGRDVHENPIYRGGPIVPLLISEPAAVAVGIAQAAIDEYIEVLRRATSTARRRRCAPS